MHDRYVKIPLNMTVFSRTKWESGWPHSLKIIKLDMIKQRRNPKILRISIVS